MIEETLTSGLLQSFKVSKVFRDNNRAITSIDFSDSGDQCLTGSDDESMKIYSCISGSIINTIHSKRYGCANAIFTHRTNNILYSSTKSDDAIRYMSTHDNSYLSYFKGHTGLVCSLELSPIDDTFLSSAMDATVRMWDLRLKDSTGLIETGCTSALIAYDPSGKVFALGSNQGLRMFSFANSGSGPFLSVPMIDPSNMADWSKIEFSNDGKYLLVSTKSSFVYLLDAFTASVIHKLSLPCNATQGTFRFILATFTPDAKFIVCGTMDGTIHTWGVDGREVGVLIYHSDPCKAVRFSPKSLLLASGDTSLALWTPPF